MHTLITPARASSQSAHVVEAAWDNAVHGWLHTYWIKGFSKWQSSVPQALPLRQPKKLTDPGGLWLLRARPTSTSSH